MIRLRPYQQQLLDGLRESWAVGHRNVMLVSPTGSGKTVVMSKIPSVIDGPGVAIAHRTELVSQISIAMARVGVEHNVIAPTSTVSFCISQHIAELGRKFYNPRARVTVAAIDTLNARAGKLSQWAADQKWWVIDECFVAGTLVQMADGGSKNIEDVRVGDMVTAFDTDSGGFVHRPVTTVFKNPAPEFLVRVVTERHVLYTTSGHPFWTKRGWVKAGELTSEDHVLATELHTMRQDRSDSHRSSSVSLAEDRSNILHSDLWLSPPRRQAETEDGDSDFDGLSRVRETGIAQSQFDAVVSADGSSVLQQGLLEPASCESVIRNSFKHQPEICFKKNVGKQSNGATGREEESLEHPQGNAPSSENTRRKRQTCDQSGNGSRSDVESVRVCHATRGQNRFPERNRAESLQDRLCQPVAHDCDRGGRTKSFDDCETPVGCSKGHVSAWERVDSVALLERDDPRIPGDGFVYNIGVDEQHTYVANGVVVHNCHHVLSDNKWGKGVGLFKARGVGFTATPVRADRRSLHVDQGGVFSDMVIGPSMRDLIDQGSLCDYRIFVPPQSIQLDDVKISSTGDYSQPSLRDAAHKSRIVGDVVEQYLRIAKGLRGITFVVDVEQANEIAKAFNDAGVPAMAISNKTPDSIRAAAVKKLRDGKLLQLVNVDLFGEGFDVPAVEVVSMARPTMSYGLYVQQFGRALRPLPGKQHGLVIDHVGNVKRHNLPDAPRVWSLMNEERTKRSSTDDIKPIPVTSCTVCFAAYTAHLPACPYCGSKPVPIGRKKPEQVDGDLVELDPEILAAMRSAVERIDGDPVVPFGASKIVKMLVKKNHRERKEAQVALRDTMALWSGIYHEGGETDSMIQRRFFHTFGIDMLSAQSLGRPDAESLKQRIESTWVTN